MSYCSSSARASSTVAARFSSSRMAVVTVRSGFSVSGSGMPPSLTSRSATHRPASLTPSIGTYRAAMASIRFTTPSGRTSALPVMFWKSQVERDAYPSSGTCRRIMGTDPVQSKFRPQRREPSSLWAERTLHPVPERVVEAV